MIAVRWCLRWLLLDVVSVVDVSVFVLAGIVMVQWVFQRFPDAQKLPCKPRNLGSWGHR